MSNPAQPNVLGLTARRFVLFDKCIGCYTCEEVCKFINDGNCFIKLYEVESGLNKPITCFHCVKAPCVTVCPTKALDFDKEGAVIDKVMRCIGCTSCMIACPFGIPELKPIGYVVKCDLCAKLRANGLEPGCIATCPTNALVWISSETYMRRKRIDTLQKLVEAFKTTESK
ncbi:MAG: 4Fe-4S dicluster domain-containing protein [Desulfurococcaceae archaeon]